MAPEVPSYVPLSWEAPAPTTNELLAAAAVRCGDVADRARELLDRPDPDDAKPLPVVVAVRCGGVAGRARYALDRADPADANPLRVVVAVCLVTADYLVSADDLTSVA